jgi:hypothetical protein
MLFARGRLHPENGCFSTEYCGTMFATVRQKPPQASPIDGIVDGIGQNS